MVTGCYAQVSAEDLFKIPEVDLIIGTHARDQLPALIERAKAERINYVVPLSKNAVLKHWKRHKVKVEPELLKVQEGCRQFCTYCIVPCAGDPFSAARRQRRYRRQKTGTTRIPGTCADGSALGQLWRGFDGKINLCYLLRNWCRLKV